MSNASLPLFEDPPPSPQRRSDAERHLRAARQLARRMARLPDLSPEQTRAGHLICRHLIAMLEQAEPATGAAPH